jgi:hypothetical protein
MTTLCLAAIPALLAVPMDMLGPAVFFAIIFITWLVNLINQSQQVNKQRKPPESSRARREQVQSEIDKFLNQTRRAPKPQTPARPGEPLRAEDVEARGSERAGGGQRRPPSTEQRRRGRKEIWEEQTGRAPPAASPPQRPKAQEKRPQQQRPAGTTRPGQNISGRHVATSVNKSTVSRDVGSGPKERIAGAVAQDLTGQVAQSVSSHLGTFSAASSTSAGEQALASTTAHRATPAEALLRMLRSPQSVRNAIVLGEVVSRPRVLRRQN